MPRLTFSCAIVVLLTANITLAQTAPRWFVGDGSTLTFIALQEGAAFEGRFEEFQIDIQFSPDQLAASHLTVSVDTGSVDTMLAARDEALRAPEFFDAMQWPVARFEASSFTSLGGSSYEAAGQLTIRDQTHSIAIPFEYADTPAGPVLHGELVIPRLLFGIGLGEWSDTRIIGADVRVLFDLQLVR